MKLKRSVTFLLILLLTVGALSGCGGAPEDDFTAESDNWVGVEDQETDNEKDSEKEESNQKEDQTPGKEDDKTPEKEEDQTPEKEDQTPEKEEDQTPEKEEDQTPGKEDDKNTTAEKESSGTQITMVSQNVIHAGYRAYGEKGDGTGNNIYNRLRRFKTMIQTNDPDIIFYNEAKATAKNLFNEDPFFSSTYDYTWQDRHSTLEGHLMSEPVLWKTSVFEELDRGHFWISPTPLKEGPGYGDQKGADVSTWVKLKVKSTGEIIYCYCAHFDPGNPQAYVPAMMQYYEKFSEIEKTDKNAYAFVGGDYNFGYRSANYTLAIDLDEIVDLRDMALNMYDDGLCQLGGMASSHNLAYGQGKELPETNTEKPQIDHIMAKPHPNMAVDFYGFDYTIYDHKDEGIAKGHISDHWGLVVKVRVGTKADYSQYQCEHDYGSDPMLFNAEIKG